jgi:hypothetical protein
MFIPVTNPIFFILDPGSKRVNFITDPDLGVKKALDPGSATLSVLFYGY